MKEASGEASMTFITIAAIALIATFIGWLWPSVIKPAIEEKWGVIKDSNKGQGSNGGSTVEVPFYFPYNVK